MKNRLAKNGKAINLRNLSIATMAGLALIGSGLNQAQAEGGEGLSSVAGHDSLYQQNETALTMQTDNSSIQVGAQTIKRVKKSLASGKKSDKVFKSLSDKISFSLEKGGLATGFAADVTPTLDKLHAQDPDAHPETSAYTLTETTETTGDNIYLIDGKYYKLNEKENITHQPRLSNTIDHSATNYTGHYINLQRSGEASYTGNAICNNGANAKLGNVIGDFISNGASVTGASKYAAGGAFYNYKGSVGNLTGDFIGNFVQSEQSYALGGGIYNNAGIIGDLTGNFIGNTLTAGTYGYGGAIYNNGATAQIGDITGDFISNLINAQTTANGGAIYNNNGTLGALSGNFSGNGATSSTAAANGGAIYNNGTTAQIGDITGDFTNNSINAQTAANGGAIYNTATLGALNGNFSGNSATSTTSTAYGGAIYNNGTTAKIEDITGDFTSNSVNAETTAYGGAIYNNNATLGALNGNFSGNSATSATSYAAGGAIYNNGATAQIGDITGDFIGNSAVSPNYVANGSAILNSLGTIGNITGNFINNTSTANATSIASYGAIRNISGTIGDITGVFMSNSVDNYYQAFGGVISTANTASSIIGNISGTFINNFARSYQAVARGGAIFANSNSQYGNVSGYFENNYVEIYGSAGKSEQAAGGAIAVASNAHVGDITATFVNNHVYNNDKGVAYGGAIYNDSATMGALSGNFSDNSAISVASSALGGAIYNYANGANKSSTIGDITGNFVNNVVTSNYEGTSTNYGASGGAICNSASGAGAISTIGDITGDFTGNSAVSTSGSNTGGAIRNGGATGTSIIGDITGNFSNNSISSVSGTAYGGAISNSGYGYIGNITGNFADNSIAGKNAYGGAIHNSGTIGDITGNYTNNGIIASAVSGNNIALGGAIYNQKSIGSISGDFVGNYAKGYGTVYARGGAIFNNTTGGVIGNISGINGNFIGNEISSESSHATGGAIGNAGVIQYINGDFIENSATSGSSYVYGGAIYNVGEAAQIGDITGDFTSNSINAQTTANGGAIYNTATLGALNGNFSDNSATSATSNAYGGAICNGGATAQIGDITGDFTNNSLNAQASVNGGAIYNSNSSGTIGNIIGNFTGNSIIGQSSAVGSAISNSGTIGDITGDFIENSSVSEQSSARGSIYNYGTIGNITGNFINNISSAITSHSRGAGIFNGKNAVIGNITGDFINNSVVAKLEGSGAALDNTDGAVIGDVTGYFENNSVVTTEGWTYGGTIWNRNSTIGDITGDIVNSSAYAGTYGNGGAIMNNSESVLGNFTGNIINSSVTAVRYARGGALYNTGTIGDVAGSFINNHATSTSDSYLALGGAISHSGDGNLLKLVADNQDIVFDGNYTEDYRGKINNGIFVVTGDENTYMRYEGNMTDGYITPKVMLSATNGGQFILNDNIDGGEIINENYDEETQMGTGQHLERNHRYDLEITGDDTGKVHLNNDILNANITHENVTTNVGDWSYLSHAAGEGINSLTMTSGVMNIPYLTTEPVTLSSFNMNGGTINIDRVDVDLQGIQMGRFLADENSGSGGTINVNSLNLLNATDRIKTQVLFADPAFANTVKYNGESPIAYSPIYIYDVSYDQLANGGHFTFVRHGIGDDSGSFNPAVLASPITNEAAAMSTINHTFEYAFEHSDVFMNMPEFERFARITGNRYALSTDFNDNIDQMLYMEQNKGVWVKPYTAFESIPLRHGPKVDSISYGTLIGADTNIRDLGRGWSNVGTLYIGYNGSQLDYSGVDTTTNGGLLGITETFYKNNFFTAITATAGAGFAESHTMYGKEDTTFLMSGVASKTGYNIEFKNGKYILQPLLIANYSNVKVFDYTNAAGVDIKSDMAHNVQLVPTLKFIGNFENGWQPYASVGMVWNILHESNARANGIKLPEMYTKPYVQYGVGLQRRWGDKFTAYGQAMVRNGGRNGVALTAGFRWALGKDEPKEENEKNVKNINNKKKVNKSTPKTSKKTVIKTVKPKSKNVARYKQLIGEI